MRDLDMQLQQEPTLPCLAIIGLGQNSVVTLVVVMEASGDVENFGGAECGKMVNKIQPCERSLRRSAEPPFKPSQCRSSERAVLRSALIHGSSFWKHS